MVSANNEPIFTMSLKHEGKYLKLEIKQGIVREKGKSSIERQWWKRERDKEIQNQTWIRANICYFFNEEKSEIDLEIK